jgi:cytochrome c5
MKKYLFILSAATILVAACAKKSTPTVAVKNEVEPAATAGGKLIFESKCGSCHALPRANAFTVSKWTGLVDWMAPKAKLSDDEKAQVLAYVHAHAKK